MSPPSACINGRIRSSTASTLSFETMFASFLRGLTETRQSNGYATAVEDVFVEKRLDPGGHARCLR
jgi:hypothetical protein